LRENKKMEKARVKGIIESILFVSDKPVTITRFADIFGEETDMNAESLNDILNEMKEELSHNESRGISIEFVSNGWQLRTKEENSVWVKRLDSIKPIRLSPSALEVLAILAYKQPVTRADVDKIRGVDSSHILRSLMDRGLIKLDGRSDLPGKPLTYSTTDEFLVTFSLKDLSDLPSQQEIEELVARSMGRNDDITGGLGEMLKQTINEPHDLFSSDKEEEEEVLAEVGKSVRLDIELVQEKVDLIFEEASRKYEEDRAEKRKRDQQDDDPEVYI
jgi:segregation and condensation protein B